MDSNRGLIFADREEYDRAIADLTCAHDIAPQDDFVSYHLARIYALAGNPVEACYHLEQAITNRAGYRYRARLDEDFDGIRDHEALVALTQSGAAS